MKIYFSGSMWGVNPDLNNYQQIIINLRKYGEVLTEHVGFPE